MSSDSVSNSTVGGNSGQSCHLTRDKKRSSKAVRERKKIQTRVKYNCIGQSKIQARIAAVNLVKVEDEMVDLSDAFEFMDWFLEHVARTQDEPLADSVVLEFRSNLLALDLHGRSRIEKVQFIMDVVRAEPLLEICRMVMNPDIELATDALEVDSEISCECDDQSDNLPAESEHDEGCVSVESPPLEDNQLIESISLVDSSPVGFIRSSMERRFVPILDSDAAFEQQTIHDGKRYSRVSLFVPQWTVSTFRSMFVSDDQYRIWKSERKYDRSKILNVRCCHSSGYTNHRYIGMYCRGAGLGIIERSQFRGLQGVTRGIGVITSGDDRCQLHWV